MKRKILMFSILFLASQAFDSIGQINSGSDGHDGILKPTQLGTEIDMDDHPDGIYHYSSVLIPSGYSVSFKPDANNSPVVWLVKGSCVIDGTVSVNAAPIPNNGPGRGGPGGFAGGNSGSHPSDGQGPGGGKKALTSTANSTGGGGSFGSKGGTSLAGSVYGNIYLLPLIGGSGGGGYFSNSRGGGGGGGAILIVSPETIALNGKIQAVGGWTGDAYNACGSGGGIRIVTKRIFGSGGIYAGGGGSSVNAKGGSGRIRFDVLENNFSGTISGEFSQGFQPVIIPASGQFQLAIKSIAGTPITKTSGVLASPDVIISSQQENPVSIELQCLNLPLNTAITVNAKPVNGDQLSAVGYNNTGTKESSTATVLMNLPRGGGIIYATATTSTSGQGSIGIGDDSSSYAQTGLTIYGERFAKVEVTDILGGRQSITYITDSGTRYPMVVR